MAARALPAHSGPPPTGKSSNPPNQTLYITALPPKLRKPDLRLSLYTLFSTHGPVLDVVALRTNQMREQAFVVFRDVRDASAAMRAEQGREFFGKELKIQYAKGKSDKIARLDGSYRMPSTVPVPETTATSLQQSIFNAPPGAAGIVAPAAAPAGKGDGEGEAKGVKRGREEESGEEEEEEEDGGQPMEEESDVEMEAESESESD